ncbi:hypothetical protein BO94DRAFT_615640 [Aspergillus sclerotioniger CBS 115572]|uniref:Wax synthase domain-containing protein n=1 Tax=Aspergillus sclerotioniger CBS 115572 TaxID=1450535 RepID=A0A317X2X3_9EURO|nr:hypothetical protein BO94DRAFT_615640 [Aspergillus sclerotioniger CBS 115572]PWY92984.1 hypothetical protein BO94DRAFT_615640 [Aspergillus sclerotioniger CBS 115572]
MPLNPLSSIGLQTAVVVTTIGFTSAHSALRPGALLLAGICTGHCISTAIDYFIRSPWASLAGGYSVMLLLHFVDIGLLTRWEFPPTNRRDKIAAESSREHSQGVSIPSWADRLRFGISASINARCIGTPDQVRNIYPSHHQGRAAFLYRTAGFAILSYVFLDFFGIMEDPEIGNRFLVASRVPIFRRLSELTAEEVIIRILFTASTAVALVSIQGGIYNLFAFTSVLSGFSEPQEWPSFYGSLSDAYSLRRVWSRVWHQCNTHKFRAIARYLTRDVLGFSSGTLKGQYAQVLTVFAVSSVMHLLIDLSAGVSISKSGALQFFGTQALGIVVEDLVSRMYSALRGLSPNRSVSKGERFLGFLWVGGFLVWSLPSYIYPLLYRTNMGENDCVVPVSIIGSLL